VKKNDEFRDIGHFISAKKTPTTSVRAGRGRFRLLRKPIDMERLLARIAQLIGRPRRPLLNSGDEGARDVLCSSAGWRSRAPRAH